MAKESNISRKDVRKEILNEISGIWKDHPLFKNKTTKDIIEMIRGLDEESKTDVF